MNISIPPISSRPTKDDLIIRKRGEVCALGRLIRDINRNEADARVIAVSHYNKVRRALRDLHAREIRSKP